MLILSQDVFEKKIRNLCSLLVRILPQGPRSREVGAEIGKHVLFYHT